MRFTKVVALCDRCQVPLCKGDVFTITLSNKAGKSWGSRGASETYDYCERCHIDAIMNLYSHLRTNDYVVIKKAEHDEATKQVSDGLAQIQHLKERLEAFDIDDDIGPEVDMAEVERKIDAILEGLGGSSESP